MNKDNAFDGDEHVELNRQGNIFLTGNSDDFAPQVASACEFMSRAYRAAPTIPLREKKILDCYDKFKWTMLSSWRVPPDNQVELLVIEEAIDFQLKFLKYKSKGGISPAKLYGAFRSECYDENEYLALTKAESIVNNDYADIIRMAEDEEEPKGVQSLIEQKIKRLEVLREQVRLKLGNTHPIILLDLCDNYLNPPPRKRIADEASSPQRKSAQEVIQQHYKDIRAAEKNQFNGNKTKWFNDFANQLDYKNCHNEQFNGNTLKKAWNKSNNPNGKSSGKSRKSSAKSHSKKQAARNPL